MSPVTPIHVHYLIKMIPQGGMVIRLFGTHALLTALVGDFAGATYTVHRTPPAITLMLKNGREVLLPNFPIKELPRDGSSLVIEEVVDRDDDLVIHYCAALSAQIEDETPSGGASHTPSGGTKDQKGQSAEELRESDYDSLVGLAAEVLSGFVYPGFDFAARRVTPVFGSHPARV